MSREQRAATARETVAICDEGFYLAPGGSRVGIADALAHARTGTILYSPENPPAEFSRQERRETRFEARDETTFQALERLAVRGGHVACLNFASAKNAGGGFLNGSLAQEEALACASGLYPCLLAAPEYYDRNRAHRSTIYLDLAIFSPQVPFFRNDQGALLERPILASVITSPAPNAGAVAQNEPGNLPLVEPALWRRAEMVLQIAAAHEVDRLVLGAWGCGVFRNDPEMVAAIFAELLRGKFMGVFTEVAFAVYDRAKEKATLRPFVERFG